MLVNDIWGAEQLFEWNTPLWEHDLEKGLRILRLAIDTHLITSHFALPLLIREPGGLVVEMTDGTREYNAEHYRVSAFYDLAKTAVIRLAFAQSEELAPHGCTAVALTPGWMRSEMMLDNYRVTEANWRDGAADESAFRRHLREPTVRGPCGRRARGRPGPPAPQRRLVLFRRAGARVRLHRHRRLSARLLALHGRGPGRRPAGGPDRLSLSHEPTRQGGDALRKTAYSSHATSTAHTSPGDRSVVEELLTEDFTFYTALPTRGSTARRTSSAAGRTPS